MNEQLEEKAEELEDYGSRELFMEIYKCEEEHIDWLETQLELIERLGEQNYMQIVDLCISFNLHTCYIIIVHVVHDRTK